ncbi:hypothetical protein Pyrde_0864 [Pyrodictium delaneyi]|uniref:ATPase dynein-related AAA domain-containing protein n=1 Tax=Pyrodictium delaneyi TaxID=1273541 RepID=A0A0P0N416_9CREN|nr:hypothetical protein Pyrde_0864 [Pyrodictium delaneyi]
MQRCYQCENPKVSYVNANRFHVYFYCTKREKSLSCYVILESNTDIYILDEWKSINKLTREYRCRRLIPRPCKKFDHAKKVTKASLSAIMQSKKTKTKSSSQPPQLLSSAVRASQNNWQDHKEKTVLDLQHTQLSFRTQEEKNQSKSKNEDVSRQLGEAARLINPRLCIEEVKEIKEKVNIFEKNLESIRSDFQIYVRSIMESELKDIIGKIVKEELNNLFNNIMLDWPLINRTITYSSNENAEIDKSNEVVNNLNYIINLLLKLAKINDDEIDEFIVNTVEDICRNINIGELREECKTIYTHILREMLKHVLVSRRVFIVGPPRAGKTYLSVEILPRLLERIVNNIDKNAVKVVVEYCPISIDTGRAELVGTVVSDNNGRLVYLPGCIARALNYAAQGILPVLVLDEVNRTEIDKVGGELLSMLSFERRIVVTPRLKILAEDNVAVFNDYVYLKHLISTLAKEGGYTIEQPFIIVSSANDVETSLLFPFSIAFQLRFPIIRVNGISLGTLLNIMRFKEGHNKCICRKLASIGINCDIFEVGIWAVRDIMNIYRASFIDDNDKCNLLSELLGFTQHSLRDGIKTICSSCIRMPQ